MSAFVWFQWLDTLSKVQWLLFLQQWLSGRCLPPNNIVLSSVPTCSALGKCLLPRSWANQVFVNEFGIQMNNANNFARVYWLLSSFFMAPTLIRSLTNMQDKYCRRELGCSFEVGGFVLVEKRHMNCFLVVKEILRYPNCVSITWYIDWVDRTKSLCYYLLYRVIKTQCSKCYTFL